LRCTRSRSSGVELNGLPEAIDRHDSAIDCDRNVRRRSFGVGNDNDVEGTAAPDAQDLLRLLERSRVRRLELDCLDGWRPDVPPPTDVELLIAIRGNEPNVPIDEPLPREGELLRSRAKPTDRTHRRTILRRARCLWRLPPGGRCDATGCHHVQRKD